MQQRKQKVQRISSVFLTTMALLLLAGCSGGNDTTSGAGQTGNTQAQTGNGTTTEGDSAGGKTLVIALSQDIDTLDTHGTTAISTEGVMVNLQSYLLKRDNEGTLHPHLAESYEALDDTTWSFTLRDNILFHNGDQLTAEDVKFSLERVAQDNKLVQHANFKTIQEVKVLDPLNFEIITDGPDPALPYRLAREAAGIFPKNYIEENGWDAFQQHPVGSGPYEFVEWLKGDRMTMKKFDDYFEGDVSEWDTVIFRTIMETSTRVAELMTGGVQIAASIPPTDLERVNSNDGTSIVKSDTTTVRMLYVNQNDAFKTSDPRVVQAIDYAIDNQVLSDIFADGEGKPTRTRPVPGTFGFDETLYDTYRYDPERARELLAEAGYTNNLEITLTSSQGRSYADSDTAQVIAGMLEEVGIKVNLVLLEASNYVSVRTNGENKELLLTGWNNTLFDSSHALGHFHSTYQPAAFGYSNPRVDELLDAAAVNMDPDSRAEQYKEVQQIVAEEMPYIYLYQDVSFMGMSDSLDYDPRIDQMFHVDEIKTK
ncbi:ABC transporter substrate-binding protein [Paenibacillus daejeonensis]|uniref:ABC transporter substrate-binding protein n=1 Tax=Paenibacillus daejeonensis TaxID=135193 RepID=UPI00036BF8CC|nr:ABC transporter substrate-binding protein [Paenibacillus daejeonensis]